MSDMRFVISPAKKMSSAAEFAWRDLPRFIEDSELLMKKMRSMSREELQKLWACSDALAELNYERLESMDLYSSLLPAIFSYDGIQYTNIAASVMSYSELDYLQQHLRIASGFYGLLKPFDGVTPYRLEFLAKLDCAGKVGLYEYWGDRIARELACGSSIVVNLASVEYEKAFMPYFDTVPSSPPRLTCRFLTDREGKLKQLSTEVKAARGMFVRWCAETEVETLDGLYSFDRGGYAFDESLSSESLLVFVKH